MWFISWASNLVLPIWEGCRSVWPPRRAEPRLSVAAGSVGIGGGQTGIYPLVTPGGWQLIGRTPLALFNPNEMPPTLLRRAITCALYRKRGRMLKILRAGIYTTVQDLGRNGFRRLGISQGGALDIPALKIANLLVGNPAEAAGLEITLGQFGAEFTHNGWIALTGAGCDAQLDGKSLWTGWRYPVKKASN